MRLRATSWQAQCLSNEKRRHRVRPEFRREQIEQGAEMLMMFDQGVKERAMKEQQ